jgi:membrane protease YdiL (CAAX protease family)
MKAAVLFLAVVFGVTWPWGFIARPLFTSGSLWSFLAGLLPTVWAPTAVALFLMYMAGGAGAVRSELYVRLRYRHGSGRWLMLAAIVPIVLVTVAIVGARAAGDLAPFISHAAILPTLGLQVITGAVGEELGWRGYLLPRVGRRFGAIAAAILMASMWAAWHVPAFFTPGMPHQFIPMPSFLVTIASFGVFLALLFRKAEQSVLPTMLAHFSLNVMLAIGGVSLTSRLFWRTMAIGSALFGILALLGLRNVPPYMR